jgi:hypothetical protein
VKPHEAKESTAKSTSQEAEDCIAKPQEAKQTKIITQKKKGKRGGRGVKPQEAEGLLI